MKKTVLICVLLWFGLTEFCFAANPVGVSIGTYGVGIRTSIMPHIVAELHYSLDQDFHTISGRGCYNLLQKAVKFVPFVGAEYGKADFNIENIKGTLTVTNVFIGSEFAVNKQLSVILDYGYGNLTLESSGFSVSGPEWIFNIGLNYYLSFETSKETTVIPSSPSVTIIQPSVSKVEVSSPIVTTPQPQPVTPAPSVIPSQTQTVASSTEPVKEKSIAPKPAVKPLTKEEKEMVDFFYESGKRLYLAKDYSGALEQFHQVLKYDSNHPETLNLVEECRKKLNR